MLYDHETAAVIRARLDIGQLLDDSAEISFLERAAFRMEMLRILDDFDQGRQAARVVLERLTDLHGQVLNLATAT